MFHVIFQSEDVSEEELDSVLASIDLELSIQRATIALNNTEDYLQHHQLDTKFNYDKVFIYFLLLSTFRVLPIFSPTCRIPTHKHSSYTCIYFLLLSTFWVLSIFSPTCRIPTHKHSSYTCSILLCLGMYYILYSTKLI